MKILNSIVSIILTLLALLFIIYKFYGTNIKILDYKTEEGIGKILNPDYNVLVKAKLVNLGWEGPSLVKVNLTCNENNWEKNKTIILKKDIIKNIDFVFNEPTIDDSLKECATYITIENDISNYLKWKFRNLSK